MNLALRPTPCEARYQPTLSRFEYLDEETIEKPVDLPRRVFSQQQLQPLVRRHHTELRVKLLNMFNEIPPNRAVGPTFK